MTNTKKQLIETENKKDKDITKKYLKMIKDINKISLKNK